MEFPALLQHLPDMLQFVRSSAKEAGISSSTIISHIELAAEEALVNIISYAYPENSTESEKKLQIFCHHRPGIFEIVCRDKGISFNPVVAEINPQLDLPIDERKIGGLGIVLIRKLVDQLDYERVNNENILKLIFKIQ